MDALQTSSASSIRSSEWDDPDRVSFSTSMHLRCITLRLSITMDASFCIEAVEEAMAHFGKPEVFNTDQGSQFISREFTTLLMGAGIKISMDGKEAWRDNVFVERIWKSVQYEEVYLCAYASVSEARASLGIWPSTTARDLTRVWDGRRPIRPTSTRCNQSRSRHNKGRNPLSDSPETVQINRSRLFTDVVARPRKPRQNRLRCCRS